MARAPESRGICAFCGETVVKRSVTKHLQKCSKYLESVQAAEASGREPQTIWHIRAQDAYSKRYWLDLEMNGLTTMDSLDYYLRAIWLECCDHLSQFTTGGWQGTEIPLSRKADRVFQSVPKLTHFYDFGTTSETEILVIGSRQGIPLTQHPITLLMRNAEPEAPCQVCGQPAKWLCLVCEDEDYPSGLLCEEHAKDHPHDDYGDLVKWVNSPRVGICGYSGPAEPPY